MGFDKVFSNQSLVVSMFVRAADKVEDDMFLKFGQWYNKAKSVWAQGDFETLKDVN